MTQTRIVDGKIYPEGKRSIFQRLLDRLFFYESMSGNGACPVYLERWILFNWRKLGIAAYLHRFIGDDWAIDPHDHPRRFISIGLWGWYWEDVFTQVIHPAAEETDYEFHSFRHRAPWLRSFPAHHLHCVRASECGNCWTLVIVLPKSRPWGFVQNGKWVPFKEYVFGGKSRKSC